MSSPTVAPRHRRRRIVVSLAAVSVTALSATLVGLLPGVASASSHREAPLIAADPPVDNTDTYAFVSPDQDKQDTVTLLANWYPFQEPNGGPNFYPWADKANYDINVDSDGDAKPDVTFRWKFTTQDLRDGKTFLYDNGPVTSLTDENLLFRQTYDLTEIRNGREKTLARKVPVAPSNTGPASMPDYSALRDQAIYSVDKNTTSFAGQAADSFFLDLRVFDLLYGGNLSETGQNTLNGYNVNTLAIQVPKNYLALKDDAARNPVIGVWSDTERQSASVLVPGKKLTAGPQVQVSRLGNPLVNELISSSSLKDGFNGSTPSQDARNAALVDRVLKPEVPALIEAIYKIKAPPTPRNDLVEIFLTGIAKNAPTLDGSKAPIQADLNSQILNKDADAKKFTPSEMIRLNMGVPVAANPNRLGVLANDFQGFPNGRRLADDVVDIELQALEGAAQSGKLVDALAKGDGVDASPQPFGTSFPYVALPYNQSTNTAGSK